jgi:hypothetical protein
MMKRAIALACALTSITAIVGADPYIEGGNGYYVVRQRAPGLSWNTMIGDETIFTGPLHPITLAIARPGAVFGLDRDCPACAGLDDFSFAAVRSWSSGVDYQLGTNVNFRN